MRIYEIVFEYAHGKDRFMTHDRFRVACETFDEALKAAERKIKGKTTIIASIEIVADTRL